MPLQHLVVSDLEDKPGLFFTARYWMWQGAVGGPRSQMQVFRAMAVAKHNGKIWYSSEEKEATRIPPNMFFLSMNMDHRTGKMEAIGTSLKVTLWAEPK